MCGRWVSQPLDSVLIHFAMSIVVRCRLKWADEFDSSEQVFEARILKNTFKIWRICQWRILRVQLSTSITISVAGIVQIKASGIRIRGGLFLMGSIEREAILLYSCQWIWYYIFTSGKAAGVGWKSLKWVGWSRNIDEASDWDSNKWVVSAGGASSIGKELENWIKYIWVMSLELQIYNLKTYRLIMLALLDVSGQVTGSWWTW